MHDMAKVLEKIDVFRDFEGLYDDHDISEATQKVRSLIAPFKDIDPDYQFTDIKVFGDVLINLMMESISEVGTEMTWKTNWEEIAWAVHEVLSTRKWSETEIRW